MENPVSEKVTVGAFAGAVTAILAWILESAADINVPGAVAAAITVVIMAGASYLKRDKVRDAGVVVLNSDRHVTKENVEQTAEQLVAQAA